MAYNVDSGAVNRGFSFHNHLDILTKMVWSQGGHIKRRLLYTIKGGDFDQISTFFYIFNLLSTPAPFLDFWLEHSRSHLFY